MQYMVGRAIDLMAQEGIYVGGANLAGGALEGYLKYKFNFPNNTEIPYLFDNPLWTIGSDATSNILSIKDNL